MRLTLRKRLVAGRPGYKVENAGLPEAEDYFELQTRAQCGNGTYAWLWLGDDLHEAVIEEHDDSSEGAALWRKASPGQVARWAQEELAAKLAYPPEEREHALRRLA